MAVFERVKAGDILYQNVSQRCGNTMMSRRVNFKVEVVSIDHAAGTAECRWNDNAPKTYYPRDFKRLRRTPGKEYDPFDRMLPRSMRDAVNRSKN